MSSFKDRTSADWNSVPAIVTYWLLGIWTLMLIGVFILVVVSMVNETQIEATTLGVLAGVIGTQTTLLVAAVSFWVGTNIGAKASGDKLAEAARSSQAALAQLAGAGPPPPEKPLGTPAPKEPEE